MVKKDFKGREPKKYWCLSDRLQKTKMLVESKIYAILFCVSVLSIIYYGKGTYLERKEEHSGIPDVVSSRVMGNEYYLDVVANSGRIDDREAFARKVIHMCKENSFHSVKFSVDVKGYPSELNIEVYLKKSDIGKENPVCQLQYGPFEYNLDYDIKNDASQFHLYLDGKEIPFY